MSPLPTARLVEWLMLVSALAMLVLLGTGAAEPKVTGPSSISVDGTASGEQFEVNFEIKSDETADYTFKIIEREEFSFSPQEKTIEIPNNDSRTFIFNGNLAQDLMDGDYGVEWETYKDETMFNSGTLEIGVGESANSGNGISVGTSSGESFKASFSIKSDETAEYTFKIVEREEFSFTPQEITVEIPEGDKRIFIFHGSTLQNLMDGDYMVGWEAHKNGTLFSSDSFPVNVGEGANGGKGIHIGTSSGESFKVSFAIKSSEMADYTFELIEREEFSFTPQEITVNIPDGDRRIFIFHGQSSKSLADGAYSIEWKAHKNGEEFNLGSISIAVGEQATPEEPETPSIGFVLATAVTAFVALTARGHRRH